MKKAKYIIIEDKGMEIPIVFCPFVQHNTVADGKNVLAAGFCTLSPEIRTWGHSVSLKVGSRPQDADIIKTLLEFDLP